MLLLAHILGHWKFLNTDEQISMHLRHPLSNTTSIVGSAFLLCDIVIILGIALVFCVAVVNVRQYIVIHGELVRGTHAEASLFRLLHLLFLPLLCTATRQKSREAGPTTAAASARGHPQSGCMAAAVVAVEPNVAPPHSPQTKTGTYSF